MKSRHLLSIVLSLILVFGVTAGSVYAQTDDLDDILEDYCVMSLQEQGVIISDFELEDYKEKLTTICEIGDEDDREDTLEEFIEAITFETEDDSEDIDDDRHSLDDRLEAFCEMTDEDKREFLAEHNKATDHTEKMNEYCSLDEDARADYIAEHKDEYKSQMKEKISDYKKDHMMSVDTIKENHKAEYERFCQMTPEELESSIDNPERLAKVTEWCEISPEERKDYKKKYHDAAMDFKDKHMGGALDRMKEKSDLSPRLRTMIMEKHEMDRTDEIREKFESKHGDADKIKSEVKMKFKNHMAQLKINMSDERKSAILDRVAEMREFKMEMRDNTSDLTDEDKQELRAQFIEKAKNMQLAWISPHHQMNVGINADEIECREGHSLVMKKSNGVPMCLKSDTALVMIERGIAVPAN